MRRKQIGSIGVDSGQVMVVDPCYLRDWNNAGEDIHWSHPDGESQVTLPTGTFDYSGACNATCSKAGHGVLDLRPNLDNRGGGKIGMAAVSGTLYGDGVYPVFAEYADGSTRPFRLVIEFGDENESNGW